MKLDLVNVKQGSESSMRFSNGNTLPFTQLPFAMAGFVPQTASDRGNWFYHPGDHSLEGIRLSHQPSPWVGDYGALVLMPQAGDPYHEAGKRWSGYRPQEAVLRPDYLCVEFLRYRARLELAPSERGAAFRIRYEDSQGTPRLAFFPVGGSGRYTVDPENCLLCGEMDYANWPVPENFRLYFAVRFDGALDAKKTCITTAEGPVPGLSGGGEGAGISVAFQEAGEQCGRLAISFLSQEQAKRNLARELEPFSFEETRARAAAIWEEALGVLETGGCEENVKRTVYSCLYRALLYPHKFYEYDEKDEPVHYCPHDGSIAPGVMYTDNGFWDTFRTVYPLLSILYPRQCAEIVEGFVQIYRDSGWLPKWPSPGETGIMPGTLIDAVIADAAVKGLIKKESLREAFAGMCKHAQYESGGKSGRRNVALYRQYGYVPENRCKESVNQTLDYVYGDFCISVVASLLGEQEEAKYYAKAAKGYRALFDPVTGFMRGRDEKGAFAPEFDPFSWGGAYCEGGAYQSSFAVYHDVEGLCALYGGKEALARKLDELFATPPLYRVGSYGAEIHEMTEMAAADFGQCAISNQPSFHLPFLYALLGEGEKTDFWAGGLAREAFSAEDDGFPGDEDNGSMAAWYLFCCMGLYPLCPGKAEYARFAPLLPEMRVRGKRLCFLQEERLVAHNAVVAGMGEEPPLSAR